MDTHTDGSAQFVAMLARVHAGGMCFTTPPGTISITILIVLPQTLFTMVFGLTPACKCAYIHD